MLPITPVKNNKGERKTAIKKNKESFLPKKDSATSCIIMLMAKIIKETIDIIINFFNIFFSFII